MPEWLYSLFIHYGYVLIAVAVLLENAGIPAPGHTVMLAGGALAQQGQLAIATVILVGATAAVVGDNIGYLLGRRGGRAFLLNHGKLLHLTPERMEAIDGFFGRHGPKAVVAGRFVTGLQTAVALFAGASGMPWWKFFLFNLAGAVLWSLTYGLAGYFFGASWRLLVHWVGHAGLFLLATVTMLALVATLLRHRERIVSLVAAHTPASLLSRGAAIAVALLASMALFGKLAEDVVNQESDVFDRTISLAVHRLQSPFMDGAMRLFTRIGSFPAEALAVGVVLLLLLRRRDTRAIWTLLGVVGMDESLNFLLKQAFGRSRPDLFREIVTLHSYSFPSGHAMAAVAIYGMLAVLVARAFRSTATLLAYASPVLAILIGLSRIYLGVHWATDVLAGFAAGSAVLLVGLGILGEPSRLAPARPGSKSPGS